MHNRVIVHVVTEHEPGNAEYPVLVVAVFSDASKATGYIKIREAERDEGGERDLGTQWIGWGVDSFEVQ